MLFVCLFNARSVGTSWRRSDISTFIQDNNNDIMLLTETWLHPASDEAKTTNLVLPGDSVLSFPCSAGVSGAKGGGITLVIRDSLKPHVATTSSFPVQQPCFETTQLTLTFKQLTNVFGIYRHLPSGRDSSVVRVLDSWSKGCRFESLQEQRDNFLLQGQLSVLTLISVSVPPQCYCSST